MRLAGASHLSNHELVQSRALVSLWFILISRRKRLDGEALEVLLWLVDIGVGIQLRGVRTNSEEAYPSNTSFLPCNMSHGVKGMKECWIYFDLINILCTTKLELTFKSSIVLHLHLLVGWKL